jgi:hypothetical protein
LLQPGHAEGSEAYVDPLVVKFRDIIEAAEMLTSNSCLRVPVKYLETTQSVCIYFAGQGLAETAHSIHCRDSVLRELKDFDPHPGTPLDLLHNFESGCFKTAIEVCHHCVL